ncbi:MAG: hypothetical protein MJ146_02195 [Clostridia bacterium]|nr:hypothetical protein [Clostridia bacterium]
MRKKLFAIIMSAMMMVTFMPAMAFASPNGVSRDLELNHTAMHELGVYGIADVQYNADFTKATGTVVCPVDASGEVVTKYTGLDSVACGHEYGKVTVETKRTWDAQTGAVEVVIPALSWTKAVQAKFGKDAALAFSEEMVTYYYDLNGSKVKIGGLFDVAKSVDADTYLEVGQEDPYGLLTENDDEELGFWGTEAVVTFLNKVDGVYDGLNSAEALAKKAADYINEKGFKVGGMTIHIAKDDQFDANVNIEGVVNKLQQPGLVLVNPFNAKQATFVAFEDMEFATVSVPDPGYKPYVNGTYTYDFVVEANAGYNVVGDVAPLKQEIKLGVFSDFHLAQQTLLDNDDDLWNDDNDQWEVEYNGKNHELTTECGGVDAKFFVTGVGKDDEYLALLAAKGTADANVTAKQAALKLAGEDVLEALGGNFTELEDVIEVLMAGKATIQDKFLSNVVNALYSAGVTADKVKDFKKAAQAYDAAKNAANAVGDVDWTSRALMKDAGTYHVYYVVSAVVDTPFGPVTLSTPVLPDTVVITPVQLSMEFKQHEFVFGDHYTIAPKDVLELTGFVKGEAALADELFGYLSLSGVPAIAGEGFKLELSDVVLDEEEGEVFEETFGNYVMPTDVNLGKVKKESVEGTYITVVPSKANKVVLTKKTVNAKANKTTSTKLTYTKKETAPVTFSKVSGNKKITVASNGKVTVKKGLKKGTYKVVVKVKASKTTLTRFYSNKVAIKVVVK